VANVDVVAVQLTVTELPGPVHLADALTLVGGARVPEPIVMAAAAAEV
jgi:hypothetical protein